jgi:hypothetical protein
MNRVSTPASWWFICAIWISYSKSVTARSPFTTTSAPLRVTYSTSNPLNASTSTLPSVCTASLIIPTRSSAPNSGSLEGLSSTPTISASKRLAARSMMSM